MQHNSKIIARLWLLIFACSIAIIFIFRAQIASCLKFHFAKNRIVIGNIMPDSSAPGYRSKPVSLLVKEIELKLYFGEPFKSFNLKEWGRFWELIYGEFPLQSVAEGLPKKNRQLTFEEISLKLINLYPDIFSHYQNNHWQSFFDLILKK